MVQIDAVYEGTLHCVATHEPSGATVATDAPVDNHGRGESFSPTDLIATALGTCMMTIMGIYGQKHDLALEGMKVRVFKEMTTEAPRRIERLMTEIVVPLPEDHPQRKALEIAAVRCPVHKSLHDEIDKPVTFRWVGLKIVS